MNNVQSLLERYQTVEDELRIFLLEYSELSYMEGSVEVVDTGAYTWSKLEQPGRKAQCKLYSVYIKLVEEAAEIMTSSGHSATERFSQSCEEVLSHIKQDSMSWDSSPQLSFDRVRGELEFQKHLLTKPVHV
ncbi:hypothetical protein [Paenibacillus sp. J22TS3]|uniref:hypothetical protein n=1 Tax=Paenibacillus sp. J22TS3 TaxID=2807192 RepID=UPI001BCAB9FB|nr:hypothetical protein [Paenibacillus sp. J22TS3]